MDIEPSSPDTRNMLEPSNVKTKNGLLDDNQKKVLILLVNIAWPIIFGLYRILWSFSPSSKGLFGYIFYSGNVFFDILIILLPNILTVMFSVLKYVKDKTSILSDFYFKSAIVISIFILFIFFIFVGPYLLYRYF